MTATAKDDLLDEVVDRELKMFQAISADGEDSDPLKNPDAFRFMRRMALAAHGEAFLTSCLSDLRQAERDGRNLVQEKYAFLNGNRPKEENELLRGIVESEMDFLDKAATLYPEIIKRDESGAFGKFLGCELQTLSSNTLELYAEELRKAKEEGRNPAIERHNWLAEKLGRPLLEQELKD